MAAITDGATGRAQRGNRTMAYDALDRLMYADSAMFDNGTRGTATCSHDALSDLTLPGNDGDCATRADSDSEALD